MAAVRHLAFFKFKFLTDDTLLRVSLRHFPKFYADRPNRWRDMAFFDFQDGGRPPFWIYFMPPGDHPQRIVGGVYRCAKLGWNWLCGYEDMRV